MAVCAVSAFLLMGCSSGKERLEKEEAYRAIGIAALDEGDYHAAIEAFNSALAQASGLGANEMDICFYKAAAQFSQGSYSDAVETYNALLESDGKNEDAYFLRGCVFLAMNESDKAAEDFDCAVSYADNDEMYLSVYHSLKGAGYEDRANAYLDEALEKKSGRKAANDTVKGKIYLLRDKYDEAAGFLRSAVEKGDMEANLFLAQAYEASGKDDLARACIDQYVEANPKSSVAYNQLGLREMEAENYKEAISCFQEGLALEEVTNEQELRSNLIAAYEYSGDFQTAKEQMQEYVKDYPGDLEAAREYLFLGKNRGEETKKE